MKEELNRLLQKATAYLNPSSNGGQNFWSSKAARSLADFQVSNPLNIFSQAGRDYRQTQTRFLQSAPQSIPAAPIYRTAGRFGQQFFNSTGQSVQQVQSGAKQIGKGTMQLFRGKTLEGYGNIGQGTLRGVLGGGQLLANTNPFVTGFRAASSIPGMEKMNVNILGDKYNIPETAAGMVEFAQNPAWKAIFPKTSKILNLTLSGSKTLNFMATNSIKGGLEGLIQGIGYMPEDLAHKDQVKFLVKNVGLGAGSEVLFNSLLTKGLVKAVKEDVQTARAAKKVIPGGENGFIDSAGRMIPVDQHIQAAYDYIKKVNPKIDKTDSLVELMTRGNIRTVVKPNEVNFEVISEASPSQLNRMMQQAQGKKVFFDLTDVNGKTIESKSFQNSDDFLSYLKSKYYPKNIKTSVMELTPQQRLRSLMTYENDLRRMGYTAKQTAKIGVNEGRQIISEELPAWNYNKEKINRAATMAVLREDDLLSTKAKLRSVFAPLENLSPDVKKAVLQHDVDLKVGKVEGIKIAQRFNSDLDPKLEWKLVQYSQTPTPDVAKALGLSDVDLTKGSKLIQQSREFNDNLYAQAKDAGVDVNYLKNHIYQQWKGTKEEIDRAITRGLSGKPGFSQHRGIKTFKEGMEDFGLKPKYTSFSQLNASAQYSFEKAMANQKLAGILLKNDQMLPANVAPGDWVKIEASFFPKAQTRIGIKETIEVPYAAPKPLADFINNYFGREAQSPASQFLTKTANLSKNTQNVVLSGGVGPVNFYTLGNTVQDLTMSLGDALSGHPVRALKNANSSLLSLIRGFLPGESARFEKEHFKSIEEMAGQGTGYGGIMDWENMKPNTVSPTHQGVIEVLWDDPTFKKYLWQRKIGMYENMRDSAISGGKSYGDAVKLAADLIKNYDGTINEMGRNQDFNNVISTFFMAPKYRESLVNTFANIGKGFSTQVNNPSYEMSRRLGLGIVSSLFIYNELNKKFNNGANLWENPPGKELELVIPAPTEDNPKNYYSIPFMPGKTAIFRRILGTLSGAIKGDKDEAIKQFGGLLSIPLSKGAEIFSNKDYFGRDVIKEDTENYGPKALQYGLWAAKSFSPGPVREGIQYAQDLNAYNKKTFIGKTAKKPSLVMAALRSGEIPIKQGSFPNAFYSAVDEIKKKYDKNTVSLYEEIHPQTGEFEVKEAKTPQQKIFENTVRSFNPNVYMMERDIAQATAQKENKEVDPLYTFPTETALRYINYQRQNPGSADGKALLKAYPEIIDLITARSDFFTNNPIVSNTPSNGQPLPSDYVEKQMDLKNWKDPQVQAYLDANTNWKNQQRELLGLTPLDEFTFTYGKKKAKIKVTRVKKFSLKKGSKKFSYLVNKKLPYVKETPVKNILSSASLFKAPAVDKVKISHTRFI